MRRILKFKGTGILFIGLLCLISTLVINSLFENDLICIIFMVIFLSLELYGLTLIIKDKYQS